VPASHPAGTTYIATVMCRHFSLTLLLLSVLSGCSKDVEVRDTMTGARTVCSPTDGDGRGPFGLPESVCECVAYFRARGWEPVIEASTASLDSCKGPP
jgi:hypothetical protein